MLLRSSEHGRHAAGKAATVVSATAFSFETLSTRTEKTSADGTVPEPTESRWLYSVIGATNANREPFKDPTPELAKVLQEALDADLLDSRLNDEQKELLLALLESFRDLFVETSLKPGRTDMLEFSIDMGDHSLIKQRPYRVSMAEGDVMDAAI
ncbi:hypothetical protein PC129_g16808 [Phytophthora cactorum]|uniref:Uncharacterized protein n=1 Tax=Phytophthora cactorum TaxID=29920 RepID=A0A8T0Y4E2_9STRA|nr:hypothetical protein PC111_g20939 [Phytophthora cactorum]KAG2815982.1 hypothetical protein PC112_g13642 [Phytophthora cactorum]KAG2828814.1 hypothetical protein PC113_g21390 [Phytophthora cactorum]KAG2878022.1 hypothetical protein PC114_g23332 [Phytophthora cactorum]KAG2900577.1 hypothetical protein PC115_g16151 [Phytophthora cactorum]